MANPRRRRGRGNGRSNGHFLEQRIATNTVAAARDESYSIVVGVVEELLKDPEVRKKIRYHTREIFKTLAEKM